MDIPSPTPPCEFKRIGYWISTKKSKKFSLLEDELRKQNITAVPINLEFPLQDQGRFDGFLHKLTDVIVKADEGNQQAKLLLSNFESYLSDHPNIVVIDAINTVRTIIDRHKTYSLLQNSGFDTKSESVFIPSFVTIESLQCDIPTILQGAEIQFPVVCKPVLGHGSTLAHQMTLVFNENGFAQCRFPCVVQSFINHGAFLYKLFAIGEESYLVKRPSIVNLFASEDLEPVHFHSDEISKPGASSHLTIRGPNDCETTILPCPEVLKCIVRGVHKTLNIGLFGVDVIVEEGSGRYGIIDVNVFPGYDGVPDYPNRIASYIRTQLDK